MLIGYARVSTDDQNPELQINALHNAGCEKIHTDKISGAKKERPELDACFAGLKRGDTLVVWKLDRLGRSLPHLVTLLENLKSRGIHFRSITENFDTSTPSGQLLLNISCCFADYERSMIRERTRAGLANAKRRGVQLGKPPVDPMAVYDVVERHRAGASIRDICEATRLSRATVYRYLGKKAS